MLGKQPYLVVHEAFIDRRSEIRSNDRIAIALYDWSGRVLRYQWPKMGKRLVHDHLRELSNAMNKWGSHILDLQAWHDVMPQFDQSLQSSVRSTTVETTADYCLQKPYAMRERFCLVATQILHQANIQTKTTYKDQLPSDKKKSFLMRNEKLLDLRYVGNGWVNYPAFEAALMKINDEIFLAETSSYRNLANHMTPQHLEFGHSVSVTRKLERTSDPVNAAVNEFCNVTYVECGMSALKLGEVVDSVICQFEKASAALFCLNNLLQEITQSLILDTTA